MNNSLIVLCLIIVATMALESGVPVLLNQIRDIKTENIHAQHFKSLLDLELSQGSKVEEVVNMIKELLDQLKADQQADDLDYAHKITAMNLDIQELELIIENLSAEKTATNTFIQDTSVELKSLGETVGNLKGQLDMLNGKEQDFRDQRDQEQLNYSRRAQTNQKVLNALKEILAKLTEAVFAQDGKATMLLESQKHDMVAQIKRELGYNNPIALLVEMTTKFDVPTVKRIIEKLETLRDAVVVGQQEEDAREQQAIQTYQTLLSEITELREKLASDYEETSQVFRKKSNEKVNAERTYGFLVEDLKNTQDLLVNTRIQRDAFETNYRTRRQSRVGEIKVVQSAYDLLSAHVEKIASQE